MSNLNKCSNCGGLNAPDAKFCSFCGSKMSTESNPPNQQEYIAYANDQSTHSSQPSSYSSQRVQRVTTPQNDKIVAGLLAIFLGGFGIHHFFLGNNERGILYLCFFWTGIPQIIGVIEGIIYLIESEEDFQQRLVNRN